ncbi:MAG: ester cyclase [Ilumatobacteraceae bacterium]
MDDTEANKRVVRQFFEEVVANGRLDLMDELVAADVFNHTAAASGWVPGRPGFVQEVRWVHDGVSDRAVEVDDMIAEGDRVVAYWTLSGVHTGDFFVPATGRTFSAKAISLCTLEDGQIVEYDVMPDALSLLQQLGALPA